MPTCSGSLRRPPRDAPALPPLSRANHVPSRLLLQSHMVTRVGEHCDGFHNGFVDAAMTNPLSPTSMPWADSSTICARRQVNTDPLPRRMIQTSRRPSPSSISRTRSCSVTKPVSGISTCAPAPAGVRPTAGILLGQAEGRRTGWRTRRWCGAVLLRVRPDVDTRSMASPAR
jgi:hypothetical protein